MIRRCCPPYTTSHLAPFFIQPKSLYFMWWAFKLKRIKRAFSIFTWHSTTVSRVASVAWLTAWALKTRSLEDPVERKVLRERESQKVSTARSYQIQIPLSKKSYCTQFTCSGIRNIPVCYQWSPCTCVLNWESQCKLKYPVWYLSACQKWPENEKTTAALHPTGLTT